jgi:hypothetical protein
MKKLTIASILGMALISGAVLAKPAVNTSEKKHPNLHAAQKALETAWEKVKAAQEANEFDLGGHAQKAKELIQQADDELKQAAETANGNK